MRYATLLLITLMALGCGETPTPPDIAAESPSPAWEHGDRAILLPYAQAYVDGEWKGDYGPITAQNPRGKALWIINDGTEAIVIGLVPGDELNVDVSVPGSSIRTIGDSGMVLQDRETVRIEQKYLNRPN